jgi:hypothetical protein
MNRETWLNALADKMAPKFESLGYPVPAFRVSIGFTSGGRGSNANGECWHSSKSADKRFEILITPDQHEPVKVAAILAHELTHAAVGFQEKHRGNFAKVMKLLGMKAPMTTSTPGEAFVEWVQPHLDELGPLPHAQLMFRPGQQPGAGAEGGEGGEAEDEGGSSNAKKKQTTRMLKAACEECGYTVRLSKKWAKELGAICPKHGTIQVDGLDDEPDEDEGGED